MAKTIPDLNADGSFRNPTEKSNQPTHEEIAIRAYEIFQARGGSDGSDLDDWLEAERSLIQRHESKAAQ
jgi:hypothetical protein